MATQQPQQPQQPSHAAPSAPPSSAPPSSSSSSSSSVPYVGSRISLISKSAIRYVGTLYTIDTGASTVALKDVRSFGTEGRSRAGGPVQPSDRVFSYIVFHGADIRDLQFLDPPPTPASGSAPAPPPVAAAAASQQQQPALPPAPKPSVARAPPPVRTPAAARAPPPPQPAGGKRGAALRGPTPRAWGPPPTVRAREAPGNAPKRGGVAQTRPAAQPAAPKQRDDARRAPPGSNDERARAGEGRSGVRRGRGRRRGGGGSSNAAALRIPDEDFDFERSNERMERPEQAPVAPLYDRNKSFFDELVPEKEMRGERNAAQRRQTDVETFGDAAVASAARRGARTRSRARRGRGRARTRQQPPREAAR